MEMLLAGVTLVSLSLATCLAAVAWKLMRDHHRFAAARIAALAALAAGADAPEPAATESIDALDDAVTPNDAGLPSIVQAPARPVSRWRTSGLSIASLVIVAGTAIFAMRGSGSTLLSAALRAASSADPASTAPPLELRSLRQTIDASGNFVVAGVVGDPAGGPGVEDAVAVVYLFDETGRCFANGRAAIDEPALRGGHDSLFEIRVAASSPVTRYRVGFRRADGSTIAHVDRRDSER